MKNFRFGNRSLRCLATCHPQLVLVANEALAVTPYDFGIIEGHRTLERQTQLYNERDAQGRRKTHIDGIARKGNHNYDPSRAFDFLPSGNVNGVPVWEDVQRFSAIAGVILATGNRLGIALRWGGDWSMNGNNADSTLHDLPHIELTAA